MEQLNSWLDILKEIKENRILDIIIAICIIILSIMISSLFSFLVIKIFKLKEKDQVKIKKHPLYKSIKRIFLFLGLYLAIFVLKLPDEWFKFCDTVLRILIIWNIAGTIANLIAPDSKLIKKIKESNKIDEDDTFVKMISRFGKIGVYIIAVFIIIAELDYDISGLVTGLRTNKCSNSSCSTRFSRKLN